jgi:glycerol-3-phosphate O-acyltransferase
MLFKRKPKVVVSWWLALLEKILVRYVRVSDEWIERVRAAAKRGPVVFVLRNRNLIDLLCVRGLCRVHNLPPLGFVAGLPTFYFLPLWLWFVRLFRRRVPHRRRARLREIFAAGGSALVFLRRPAVRGALGSLPVKVDGIRMVVEVQRELGSRVMALPTVFLWGEDSMRRPGGRGLSFVLGTNEYPRLMRSLWMLMRRRSVHGAWIEDPVDLAAIRDERGSDDEALAGTVRAGIGRRIEMIRRARLGSHTKPSARLKAEVIGSRRLQAELRTIAAAEDIPLDEIEPRARAIINKLATDFRPRVLSLFAAVMAIVWRRIYTGLDVREQDLENLRQAVGRGPLLILPTHKSHIDYIVISQVMRYANIMMPHIAAGENLSFWPLGWLFRSSGAFFIRRKFISDRFYTAVVNAYIRRLIHQGCSIEVFIEGGRSRTGKLLRPKLGMLEMALKGIAVTPGRTLQIMPIFIGYEQVIEEKSYVHESEGKPKKAETVARLLRSTKVLFHRYGRLHVRTGQVFSVGDVLDDRGWTRGDLLQGQPRRTAALDVATRTLTEINRISVATPSAILATVLLTAREPQIDRQTLRQQTLWLAGVMRTLKAPLGELVERWLDEDDPPAESDALGKTIDAFVKGGRISIARKGDNPSYEIPESERLPLDYYKNNIVHFLVPVSLVAASCLSAADGSAERSAVTEDLALMSKLYHWELMLPAYTPEDETDFAEQIAALLDAAVSALEQLGLIEVDGSRLVVADRERTRFVADVLQNFHETYYAALLSVRDRALGGAAGDPLRRARQRFEELIAEGRFAKPEGRSRLTFQSAFQAFKELHLSRPASDEQPFAEGELGDRLIGFLERAIG